MTTGTTFCVKESSLVRPDSVGNFYARGRIRSYRSNCSTERNRPVAYLSQTFYLLFMKTQGGDASICAYSPFYYNQKVEFGFTVELPFKDTAYCGRGWYNMAAYGYIWENGRWHGGEVYSGWELLSP